MTPDDDLLKQLIETFHTELESLLAIITDNLRKIEAGESMNELSQSMEEISRSGRNIKVSALSIGIDELGKIAELIEKLFAPSRKISLDLIHLTFRAVSGMPKAMQQFIEKKPLSANLRELLDQLQSQLELPEAKENIEIVKEQTTHQENPSPTPKTAHALDNDFVKKIVETFKTELQENLIIITDGLLQLEKGVKSEKVFQALLDEMFRVAHNIKGSARGIGATEVGEIAHSLETLFTAIKKHSINISSELVNLCLQALDYMNEAMHCYSDAVPLSFDLQKHLLQLHHYTESSQELLPDLQDNIEPIKANKTHKPSEIEQTKTNEFESIRVTLKNLDRISAYMEEIQAIKITIEENYAKLAKINFRMTHFEQSWKKKLVTLGSISEHDKKNIDTSFIENINELTETTNTMRVMQRELRVPVSELSVLLNALQDEVRTLRLIPVTSQLRYFPRIVRDLANELQKSVNLEIKSNNVKIDKMILDGLKDPLIHLLRNAIDHGIESTEIRQAAGKSPQGNIIIEVIQEDNQIVFRISDDGAGIELNDVIHIALKKHMISQAELNTIKKNDIYEFIFRPGFTTREVATDISGRGVGLDVVRSNLLRLKGQVNLKSTPGKGTDFFLRVPLTLATERGLIISCCNQLYVFITSTVESVLLLKKQDIIEVEGSPAILVKEQPVLLCSLSKILHLDKKEQHQNAQFCVVIIKKNQKRVALFVDEIIGEREIVLKPLQEPLTNIPCIIGATLTGSNQINFVLNSSEIIKKTLIFAE